jgi:hypothetical protein
MSNPQEEPEFLAQQSCRRGGGDSSRIDMSILSIDGAMFPANIDLMSLYNELIVARSSRDAAMPHLSKLQQMKMLLNLVPDEALRVQDLEMILSILEARIGDVQGPNTWLEFLGNDDDANENQGSSDDQKHEKKEPESKEDMEEEEDNDSQAGESEEEDNDGASEEDDNDGASEEEDNDSQDGESEEEDSEEVSHHTATAHMWLQRAIARLEHGDDDGADLAQLLTAMENLRTVINSREHSPNQSSLPELISATMVVMTFVGGESPSDSDRERMAARWTHQTGNNDSSSEDEQSVADKEECKEKRGPRLKLMSYIKQSSSSAMIDRILSCLNLMRYSNADAVRPIEKRMYDAALKLLKKIELDIDTFWNLRQYSKELSSEHASWAMANASKFGDLISEQGLDIAHMPTDRELYAALLSANAESFSDITWAMEEYQLLPTEVARSLLRRKVAKHIATRKEDVLGDLSKLAIHIGDGETLLKIAKDCRHAHNRIHYLGMGLCAGLITSADALPILEDIRDKIKDYNNKVAAEKQIAMEEDRVEREIEPPTDLEPDSCLISATELIHPIRDVPVELLPVLIDICGLEPQICNDLLRTNPNIVLQRLDTATPDVCRLLLSRKWDGLFKEDGAATLAGITYNDLYWHILANSTYCGDVADIYDDLYESFDPQKELHRRALDKVSNLTEWLEVAQIEKFTAAMTAIQYRSYFDSIFDIISHNHRPGFTSKTVQKLFEIVKRAVLGGSCPPRHIGEIIEHYKEMQLSEDELLHYVIGLPPDTELPKCSRIDSSDKLEDLPAHTAAIIYERCNIPAMTMFNTIFRYTWSESPCWASWSVAMARNMTSRVEVCNGGARDAGGPRKQFYEHLGKEVAETFFEEVDGYLLPKKGIALEDCKMIGMLLFRSIYIDDAVLGLNLHPALLVTMTTNRLSNTPWKFTTWMLGNDWHELISPRSKFTERIEDLMEDLQERYSDHIDAMWEISTSFISMEGTASVASGHNLYWPTPRYIRNLIKGRDVSISAILDMVKVKSASGCDCGCEDDHVPRNQKLEDDYGTALKNVLESWSPERVLELWKFWFATQSPKFNGDEDRSPTVTLYTPTDGRPTYIYSHTCSNSIDVPRLKYDGVDDLTGKLKLLLESCLENQRMAEAASLFFQSV